MAVFWPILYICICSTKKVPVRRTGAYRQKKSTGIVANTVANTVANVIAALVTYQLPTMLVKFMTQFPVILLNDLSFSSPIMSSGHAHLDRQRYDMACREVESNVGENFWGGFLYGVCKKPAPKLCAGQGNDSELFIPTVKILYRGLFWQGISVDL